MSSAYFQGVVDVGSDPPVCLGCDELAEMRYKMEVKAWKICGREASHWSPDPSLS